MSKTENIMKDVSVARRELKNIRQEVMKLRANVEEKISNVGQLLAEQHCMPETKSIKDHNESDYKMTPIGYISSCFKNKNGIPRQPSLCESSKATLEINKTFFTNPEHSLIGLSEFSHIWILFVFHKNAETSVKAKVHPPRLDGKSVGVFSTRSPHRPCAVGLSLTKLDKITGNILHLSGVDMLDGTPVLDIKPYIATYDSPKLHKNEETTSEAFESKEHTGFQTQGEDSNENKHCSSSSESFVQDRMEVSNGGNCMQNLKTDETVQTDPLSPSIQTLLKEPSSQLEVVFTERAKEDIKKFHSADHGDRCIHCLNFLTSTQAAKQAIIDILQNDPRSVYRRNKCQDKLYFFEIDKLHVTCWFDDVIAEVLRIKLKNNG